MVCMTSQSPASKPLYPKVRNVKKANLAVKIMLIISVIAIVACIIVNLCTSKKYLWCLIVVAGIIYTWITVMYSIHRSVNIGSSVTLQFIIISVLNFVIDYVLGYKGWSINISIPIIIIIANITMLVLTICSINRYYKYAIYQLIIFAFSMVPLIIYFVFQNIITIPLLTIISSSVALFTFVMSLLLCGENIIEELDRRLHT